WRHETMNRMHGWCLALSALALVAPAPARAEDDSASPAAAPAWLRAPATRGPIAGLMAYDGRWAYGSLAAGLPLGARPRPRDATDGTRRPTFAWSLNAMLTSTGRPGEDGYWTQPNGALLLDRSGARTGAWLGIANAERPAAGAARAGPRLGLGLWRAL